MSSVARNYDFIIVGGGSSGSSLAAILASKGPTLLIERAANHTSYPQSTVNDGWPQISSLTYDIQRHIDSGHWTGTPNILGGGSAMNAGTCRRAEKSVYESINIDLDSMENAFEYIEDRICLPADTNELTSVIVKAWEHEHSERNTSWAKTTTTQGEESEKGTIYRGRTIMPTRIQPKRRPVSFLFERSFEEGKPSILDQGNLTVYLLTKVKRVIFDENTKVAVGVDVDSPSGEFIAYVRRGGKVFLNAGVYETPKLLMLSGIGPSKLLSSLEIPIVYANDYVGQNLIDRKAFYAGVPIKKKLQGDTTTILNYGIQKKDYWISIFNKFGTNTWGLTLDGCSSCAPIDRTPSCVENLFSAALLYGGGNMQQDSFHPIPFMVAQRRPTTRGYMTLTSSDYNDAPIIYDGWSEHYEDLSNDALHDLEVIVNATQDGISNLLRNTNLLRDLGINITSTNGDFPPELMNLILSYTDSFVNNTQQLNCTFAPSLFPKNMCISWSNCVPTIPQLEVDKEALSRTVFDTLKSIHHMSGTCKAGDVVEKGTFEVKGVKGLYIGDLSILTQPVDTHPMLTAISLGVILGNSTESIPSGNVEAFALVFSYLLCSLVLTLLCWIARMFFSRRKKKERKEKLLSKQVKTDHHGIDEEPHTSIPLVAVESVQDQSKEEYKTTEKKNPTTLMRWNGVSCTYTKGKSQEPVTTLYNNFGSLKEGELTAIMGPSGAAKSTLLDILAGRKSLGRITGNFSVFGQESNVTSDSLVGISEAIKGHSAYIPQQEFFYPTQSVEEALEFTVNMKFGRAKNNDERTKFVYWCLNAVGLDAQSYASRSVGGDLAGGISIRGLSGGERKRLALASVLALKPKMLFIDELTSGLDSENAWIVMKLLKDLSIKQNVASMVIIHQPSPKVFSLFDNLILLSKGSCLYSGSCSSLSTFYERSYDEACPDESYIADDLIYKASIFDISTSVVEDHLSFRGENVVLDSSLQSYLTNPSAVHDSLFSTNGDLELYSPPSWYWKLLVVFNRNLMNQYLRNIGNVSARFGSYSFLSLLVGAIFYQVGKPADDSFSITLFNDGLTFEEATLIVRTDIFILNTCYLLPFATIPVFVGDKRFFAAESALGLYSPWIYGISQIILEAIFVTMVSIAQTCIIVPMCAMLNPTVSPWISFFTILSVLVASGLVGSTMVFFCSMVFPTQDLAFIVGSTIATLSLALSGGFLPVADMIPVPKSFQWISPVKYSLQSLLISQLQGTSAEKLLDIGEYNAPATVKENLIALLGFFVVFSALSAIAMIRVKETR